MRGRQTTEKMKLRTKQFAKAYIDNKLNGTKTVLELYNVKNRKTAGVIAVENLIKPSFKEAIIEEMNARGLTDEMLDMELSKVVRQDTQLSPKVSAIQEANKLKRRYPKENTEHKHLHLQLPTKELRDKRLKDLLAELQDVRQLGQVNTALNEAAGRGGETPDGGSE